MTDFDWNNDPMMATPRELDFTFHVRDLLILQMGAYSDSSFTDPVKVVREFTKKSIAEAFRAYSATIKRPETWPRYEPQSDEFLPWLVANGYVEDVPNVRRWHIDSYGDFEP